MSEIEELKQKVHELSIALEVIVSSIGDQQLLVLQSMAHQQAGFSALRDLISKTTGQDKTTIRQAMEAGYEKSLKIYSDQFLSWKKSSSPSEPLRLPPILPDDLGNN